MADITWGIVSGAYTWCRVQVRDDRLASRWLDQVEAGEGMGYLHVLLPDPPTDRLARALLRKYGDVKLSYVDAVSLAILQLQEIETVFAFDRHLALAGVLLMPGAGRSN